MDNLKTVLSKFIADLEVRALDENVPWVRGYYKGQLEAYKIALMHIDTQIFIKDLQEKTDTLTYGGK